MNDYCLITDGSCNNGFGGCALVFLKNGKYLKCYSKGFTNTTNNQMELLAIILGLRAIKKPMDSLTIYTDSMYCFGCAVLGWIRKANVKLWGIFDKEHNRVCNLCNSVRFEHVKGHQTGKNLTDIAKWNNYVDNLATQARTQIESKTEDNRHKMVVQKQD